MCKQTKMLRHSRHIDLILKVNNTIGPKTLPLLHRLLDETFTLLVPINLVSSTKIIERCLVSVQEHLIFKEVDSFG